MPYNILKTRLPEDLSNRYLVTLSADLRGSTQTNKYGTADSKDYPLLGEHFRDIALGVERNVGRCILEFDAGKSGDDVKAAFFNPWPDIAVFCAIYFATHLHKEILAHGFNSHGVAVGVHIGKTSRNSNILNAKPSGFTRTARVLNFISKSGLQEKKGEKYKTKIIITDDVYGFLPPKFQDCFDPLGKRNIAKGPDHKYMRSKLFELKADKIDYVINILSAFFDLGLIGVLPKSMCPRKDRGTKVDIDFLEYMVDSAFNEINILQTFIPFIKDFEGSITRAINDRKVNVRILMLNPEWSTKNETVSKLLEPIASSIRKRIPFRSPLAVMRGRDLSYPDPFNFYAEILTCASVLQGIKKPAQVDGLYRYYDATPSVCTHKFDDLLFVGSFLQDTYAVATPHYVFMKGSELFNSYAVEFDKLWEGKSL